MNEMKRNCLIKTIHAAAAAAAAAAADKPFEKLYGCPSRLIFQSRAVQTKLRDISSASAALFYFLSPL